MSQGSSNSYSIRKKGFGTIDFSARAFPNGGHKAELTLHPTRSYGIKLLGFQKPIMCYIFEALQPYSIVGTYATVKAVLSKVICRSVN